MIKIGNPNKHKYTAVVPTMLKSPRFQKLVEDLQNEPFCDEVIIIDNSGNLEPSIPYHPKQRYICEGRPVAGSNAPPGISITKATIPINNKGAVSPKACAIPIIVPVRVPGKDKGIT